MSGLTARDIHQLDQAAVDAAGDVDALADDPETTLRLADRGPAVYAAQLTADLAAAAHDRPMTLAAFAAWQTIRRVQERAELRAEIERQRRSLAVAHAAIRSAHEALTHGERACRYHGINFEASDMAYGEPRCESCRQPYRVQRAFAAMDLAVRSSTLGGAR